MGQATEPAAYEMSKQRLRPRSGVDMNLFMAKRTHPHKRAHCLPSASPGSRHLWRHSLKNHYNSITIPSSHYLRHDCICCSAKSPTKPPAQPPRHRTTTAAPSTSPISCECNQARWGKVQTRMSFGMCGEPLSSSTFYTCSSQSEWLHPPPTMGAESPL